MFFTAKVTRVTLRCDVFFITFSYHSHLKHLVLRAFLEDCLPEMLSKLGVWAERGMKVKKTWAIAPAALGGCGGLGQLWEALAELRPPFIHGSMDHGSMDKWIHGSMDPWIHGSIYPWIHEFHTYVLHSINIWNIYIYRERERESQTEICLSQTQIPLSQTQIPLSQTQLRQLACPKSTKIVTNRVPVAPFELKLSQNESYGLQEPFKPLPALREPISGPKFWKNVKNQKLGKKTCIFPP